MISIPEIASEESGREFHHHVPTHGHDIGFPFPGGANQHDRTTAQDAGEFPTAGNLFS
jgi:hypothetical protein